MVIAPPNPTIRSFVTRAGRMTRAQERALAQLWPSYGIDVEVLENKAPDAHAAPAATLDLDAIFGRRAARVLEIGFGNGENLASIAAADRARDHIGIEVHRPGVGHLMLRAHELGLTNLRVICADAVTVLATSLAPAALDAVLILFPDPWHKKRHHKRRLVQSPFLDLLATRLADGALLHVATDWEPYAVQILEVLEAHPEFVNVQPGGGCAPRPPWRIETRFEKRGLRLGHAVHDVAFRRISRPGTPP
jgi:tRNA (guanine-N7-)-methyltransferase